MWQDILKTDNLKVFSEFTREANKILVEVDRSIEQWDAVNARNNTIETERYYVPKFAVKHYNEDPSAFATNIDSSKSLPDSSPLFTLAMVSDDQASELFFSHANEGFEADTGEQFDISGGATQQIVGRLRTELKLYLTWMEENYDGVKGNTERLKEGETVDDKSYVAVAKDLAGEINVLHQEYEEKLDRMETMRGGKDKLLRSVLDELDELAATLEDFTDYE